MQKPINSVVIVGGGTAGWMAAASLQHHFIKTGLSVTVVDSSEIGTVGVGEATTPTIRNFYRGLGLTDKDVMRAVNATCKLGIQFNDWSEPGSSYIHPFGLYGDRLRGVDFHHYWVKLKKLGDTSRLCEYSLGVALAEAKKISTAVKNPPSDMSHFDWALHLDATLFANVMKNFAMERGCKHIDSKITQVKLRESDGFIESLALENGETIQGDLFIDCSGFRGLLIEEALETGYENWGKWLLCDSAWAGQTELDSGPLPYTRVNAQPAGWQWKIPLTHRMGNGHVYSSQYMNDDEALRVFNENLEGPLIQEPRKFKFVPGHRKKFWNKNCIALGLAAGFLEPLESTSIALIETGIEKIKQLFPDQSFDQHAIDQFNDITRQEYERVRDFLILHYRAGGRNDTEFWRAYCSLEQPETLQKKNDLFQTRGYFHRMPYEMFQPVSWLAVYVGSGVIPDSYDPAVENYETEYLRKAFAEMRSSIQSMVARTPDHAKFIAELNDEKLSRKWA